MEQVILQIQFKREKNQKNFKQVYICFFFYLFIFQNFHKFKKKKKKGIFDKNDKAVEKKILDDEKIGVNLRIVHKNSEKMIYEKSSSDFLKDSTQVEFKGFEPFNQVNEKLNK